MAKQHVYTRAKEGLFTHCEGYDTVAVSANLNYDYIKKNLYPLCFYDKNNLDFEPDIYYYRYAKNCGKETVIFGKNSYIHSTRNYIACRNIVIDSAEELDFVLKNFEQLIEFDNYSNLYDRPQILKDIDLKKNIYGCETILERDFIFKILNLDILKYKYLLYSIIKSVQTQQTVYIKLNCDLKLHCRYAKKLLKVLFLNIPLNLKKKISYITYSPKTNLKLFFNIVFLNDCTINTDGIFIDLTDSNFHVRKNKILDFCWTNIDFANMMLIKSYVYNDRVFDSENLISQLNSFTDEILKICTNRFNVSNSTKFTSQKSYLDLMNLFFDLLSLNTVNSDILIKSVKRISNQKRVEYESEQNILDTINFLLLKKIVNTKAFKDIVYSYYKLDFDSNIDTILNNLSSTNDFEVFTVLSYFYIKYTDGILNSNSLYKLQNSIFEKLCCFETTLDIRKENIDGLSVYLWTRYRAWI